VHIITSKQPLVWGCLELPLFGILTDWNGAALDYPFGFSLAVDPTHLWFISAPQSAQQIHPHATNGKFMPELWKYDVAELFLGDPDSGNYLEFNLAANGAWWASKFSAIRRPAEFQPAFQNRVKTFADESSTITSVATLSIPLDFLAKEINFSKTTTINVTAIQGSPEQTFLSATKLAGDDPDFHQPSQFSKLENLPMDSIG